MAGEVGVSGGFLIPAGQAQEILTARGEAAFVRPRARVVPMSSRVVPFPVLDYSQGAAGVNAFTGGIRVYWTEENTNITESQPTFKNVDLHARGLAGYVEIPNGLIQDSAISLEAFLSGPNGFGGALAAEEDYQALNGNGAGKFMGIIGSPGELTVTRSTSSDFKFVDAVTMMSKMLMTSAPVWVINQSVMPKLLQFADAASFNIFVLNASMGLSGTLLGIPIDWTGKNPALGTKGDVCLVDWGFYLIGDRQQITVDVDRSYKFQADQTALRIVERVDGQPWLATTITLMDGSTTVSPYVVLN
ncbi:MAG: phage major capsid protein [bacterium]